MAQPRRAVEPSPAAVTSKRRDEAAHLVARRNSLVSRLETGTRQIEQLRTAGEDVEELERFWVRLLMQYEQVCDQLSELESPEDMRRAS